MNTSTNPSTTPAGLAGTQGGMFRTADGRNMVVPFVLITSLFLLWGFCNGMIDILNKHFQDTLRINKEQSGLVQAANRSTGIAFLPATREWLHGLYVQDDWKACRKLTLNLGMRWEVQRPEREIHNRQTYFCSVSARCSTKC